MNFDKKDPLPPFDGAGGDIFSAGGGSACGGGGIGGEGRPPDWLMGLEALDEDELNALAELARAKQSRFLDVGLSFYEDMRKF